MLSGTRANIAVKIFGEDLLELREVAKQVETVMGKVAGVVDLSIEQQMDPDWWKISHGIKLKNLMQGNGNLKNSREKKYLYSKMP